MTEPEANRAEMDSRFKNRRKLAFISFWVFIGTGTAAVLFGFTSDGAAERVIKLFPLITVLTSLYSTIIIAYFTTASYEQGRMK